MNPVVIEEKCERLKALIIKQTEKEIGPIPPPVLEMIGIVTDLLKAALCNLSLMASNSK